MTEPRTRSNVFGEAADDYAKYRPDYPAALVSDLLAEAGPGPVLEVGAGTGKATAMFAQHGPQLTALEPDARMAAVLRRQALPGVEVTVGLFESWQPPQQYGLVYSAQAWHWVSEDKRNDLAYAALAPGGLLGLIWNAFHIDDPALFKAFTEIDERYWPGSEEVQNHWQTPASPEPDLPFAEEWASLRLHDDERFTDLRGRKYRRTLSYSAHDFAGFQSTTSRFRMLEPEQLTAIQADLVAAIEAHGGTVALSVVTELATARRV